MYCLDLEKENLKIAGESETEAHRRVNINLIPCLPTNSTGDPSEICTVTNTQDKKVMDAKLESIKDYAKDSELLIIVN